ncbi:MAG TPA: hypothetical protein DHW42_10725 [Candidatus Marinimicrobia bacterium]|nr:hypothetical protein [Candidatus Neomarinimicrobiota bacterium]
MIKTIFFDLGNVLVHVDKDLAIREIANLPGFDLNMVMQIAASNIETAFEKGLFSIAGYIGELQQQYDVLHDITAEQLVAIWQKPFTINQPVWKLVPTLKRQAAVILLSNTNELHIRAIEEKYSLLKELDNAVLSFQVGARKPEELIYREALKIAAADPDECLFIDDLPENVAAARQMGIHSHRFETVARLKTFLTDFGFYLN